MNFIVVDFISNSLFFLKIEDIYAELYNVKCRTCSFSVVISQNIPHRTIGLEAIRAAPEARRIGTPQPRSAKCTTGVLLFVALCLVIWFPLLIVSAANPTNKPNPVTQISLDVSVKGWDPLFHVSQPDSV